jgi:hypothetical protein
MMVTYVAHRSTVAHMTAARPFPLVATLLSVAVAFAAAFGIGLATKKASSGAPSLPKAPVVALPSHAPKVAALRTASGVPALAAKPRKHHTHKTTAPTGSSAPATPTASAPTQSEPTHIAPSAPAPAPAPKTGGGSTGGGSTGGGTVVGGGSS